MNMKHTSLPNHHFPPPFLLTVFFDFLSRALALTTPCCTISSSYLRPSTPLLGLFGTVCMTGGCGRTSRTKPRALHTLVFEVTSASRLLPTTLLCWLILCCASRGCWDLRPFSQVWGVSLTFLCLRHWRSREGACGLCFVWSGSTCASVPRAWRGQLRPNKLLYCQVEGCVYWAKVFFIHLFFVGVGATNWNPFICIVSFYILFCD